MPVLKKNDLVEFVGKITDICKGRLRFTARTEAIFLKGFPELSSFYSVTQDVKQQIYTVATLLNMIDSSNGENSFVVKTFLVSVLYSYMYDIYMDETQSVKLMSPDLQQYFKFSETVFGKAHELINDINSKDKDIDLFDKRCIGVIRHICEKARHAINLLKEELMIKHDFDTYRMNNAVKCTETIKEQLIQATWHPTRIKWCLDCDEVKEIFG